MSVSIGLQQSTGATTAQLGAPGSTVHMLPTEQVYTHHGHEINLYPYATSVISNRYDNILPKSQIEFNQTFTGYDVVRRSLKAHYTLTIVHDPVAAALLPAASSLRLSEFIEPYPDAINNFIDSCQVTTDGTLVEMNNTRETWLANQVGRSHDLAAHTSTYNGKGDGSYWDYQYVNQKLLPNDATSTVGGSTLPPRSSSKLIASNNTSATFFCTDYITNGLFLPEGDAEQEQGLTNLNRLGIRIKFNENYGDIIRYTNKMKVGPGTSGFQVAVTNLTLQLDFNAMDTRFQMVPTISQRPVTGIRSHYQAITNPIATYNFWDKTTYPADRYPKTVSVNNYTSNYQFSHLILGIQKRGRNVDIYGIGGSPFTITNVSISTSNGAEQLKFFTNTQLAALTEGNTAWWPTNKYLYTSADPINPANLPHTQDMVVPAAGAWIVLSPKDYTQGRPTTDGLIAKFTMNISVGLALHADGTAANQTNLSIIPADYELVMLSVIPSIVGMENNQMQLQMGRVTESQLNAARNAAVADPASVGMMTGNLGASVRANSSTLTAAGGGIKDWFRKAKSYASNIFKSAVRDPVGTFNKGMSAYNDAKSYLDQGKNLIGKYTQGAGIKRLKHQ